MGWGYKQSRFQLKIFNTNLNSASSTGFIQSFWRDSFFIDAVALWTERFRPRIVFVSITGSYRYDFQDTKSIYKLHFYATFPERIGENGQFSANLVIVSGELVILIYVVCQLRYLVRHTSLQSLNNVMAAWGICTRTCLQITSKIREKINKNKIESRTAENLSWLSNPLFVFFQEEIGKLNKQKQKMGKLAQKERNQGRKTLIFVKSNFRKL